MLARILNYVVPSPITGIVLVKKETHFQEGLPRGLAVLTPSKNAQQIVITESPLEAAEVSYIPP